MKKDTKLDFKNMQLLREKKNMTQVKLSMLVGVSQQSITYYETNTRVPSLPVAIRIAKVLNTNIEGLFNENDIISKYYALEDSDKETINKMIESLYEKTNHKE